MKQYIALSDRFTEWTGGAVSWLTTVLVVMICWDVVMRYLFNWSAIAVFELEWHVFSLIFLLGAAFALKHDRHVRVDVLYTRLSDKGKAWVNVIGSLLFLLPLALILISSGWDFVINSLKLSESSADAGGLPARYIIKAAIPLGFVMVLIQALSLFLKDLLTLMGHSKSEEP